MKKISQIFEEITVELTHEWISIGDLIEHLHERGFGFLLLILSVPMALPIPVPPGINILLATPLILLTAQQAIGFHSVWLPGWIKNKSFDQQKLHKIIKAALPWLRRAECFTKPRFEFLTIGYASNIVGIMGLIMALAICVPLPLTNTVPSLGIALMAIGLISRDGLAVFAGALAGILWVTMLSAVLIFLGVEGIDIAKDSIKSLV